MADKKKVHSTKKVTESSKSWWTIIGSAVAMLVWVGVSVIVSQLVVGYLMLWIVGEEAFDAPLVTAIYSALSYILALLLVIFVPSNVSFKAKITNDKTGKTKSVSSKPKPSTREELGLQGWPTWTDIGLAPVGFVAQLILAGLLVWIFSLFPWFDTEQAQELGYSALNGGFDRVVAFIALVVIAPIAEEIIFRGWLYGRLRRKFSEKMSEVSGMILSILLVSLLFGIVHLQWNVGVNVFAVSVVLCGLREITGTIYSGIILHMLKNGVAFYLVYVVGIA